MRIVFMGSSGASAMCLKGILRYPSLSVVGVVTQPDRPAGRGRGVTECECKRYAKQFKLKNIISPESVNTPEVLEQIRRWRPDAIAVVAYGQFLKEPLLELPRFGCINCHFSLLPKFRGAAPVQAAIAAGEKVTGVSVIRMGPGMDDGDVLQTAVEPICSDDNAETLMYRLAILGGVTLAKTFKLIAGGNPPVPVPQVHDEATFAHKMKKTDGLVDWSRSSAEIERRLRAYTPWPGCYTFLPPRFRKPGQTGRLTLIGLEFYKVDDKDRGELPGTVLKITDRGPVVRTGTTALRLLAVKPEGSRAMDGASFVNGRPLKPGVDMLVNE